MRCNQVSIFVDRFGKYVPKDYPADVQRVHVYCDDGASVYAALSKAYACVINELNEYEHIGARCDVSTNEFLMLTTERCTELYPLLRESMIRICFLNITVHQKCSMRIFYGLMNTERKSLM